ncbi:MAG: OB-fold domain-containing protein [bacterium]
MESWHPFRVLPAVDATNEHFWTSGARGVLAVLRCARCATWIHPPAPICPSCSSRELAPQATSGRGTLVSYTINHQPWIPGFDPPYVIALVELDDQPGLRITSNLIGCALDSIEIGLPVEVCFDEYEGVWIPLFRPRSEPAPASDFP